jgi:hypothetical protein
MVLETRNVEWISLNSQRAYPLAEGATSLDISGSVKIPDDLIVDIMWTINTSFGIDTTKFHIFSILSFSSGVVIEFGYDGEPIGTTTISKIGFIKNTSYHIVCSGVFADSDGIVTIGSLFTTNETIFGEAQFDLTGAPLVPTVIRRALKGVTGVYVRDADALSTLYQGDVVLSAGANVTLSSDTISDTTTITVNAIPGEGNVPPEVDENGNPLNPLLTINGIFPDSTGNFVFAGDFCIKFEGGEGHIELNNDCSSPCCGCDDLVVVQTELDVVRAVIDEINIESGRLAAEVQAIAINLVASKTDGAPTEVQRMIAIMTALLDNADVSADCVPACPAVMPEDYMQADDDSYLEMDDDTLFEI